MNMENLNNNVMNKYEVQVRLAEELGIDLHVFLKDQTYSEEKYQEIKANIVNIAKKHLENKE